jgi:hypothetical protein
VTVAAAVLTVSRIMSGSMIIDARDPELTAWVALEAHQTYPGLWQETE